jgi:hypothetical protein
LPVVQSLDVAVLFEIPDGEREVLLRTSEHLFKVDDAHAAAVRIAPSSDVEKGQHTVEYPPVTLAMIA